jgi:DNA-binding response OmpR family regulator
MTQVLIIDDDPHVRGVLEDALTEVGFDVHVADSGAAGLACLDKNDYKVVVTDILMPDKDGIETLIEIRAARSRAKVLVVSGGGSMRQTNFLDAAKEFGADATMSKPVDVNVFCAIVTRLANG